MGQCSGQLIGVRQYTLFHSPDAVRRLADGLPRRGTAPIQLEFFDLGAVEDPAKRRARHTAPHTSARPVPCPGPLETATAAKRIRHRTLFWWLRHWAYGEARGASLTTWARRVHLECLAMLAVMPAPRLPLSEVEAMAWDVASWVWSRPPLDRSWRAQFFRGVKREYGRVSHGTVAALWERNRTIVEAVQGGRSRRAVAGDLRVSHWTVMRVLAARETWMSPGAKLETLAAIWGPHHPPPGGGASL